MAGKGQKFYRSVRAELKASQRTQGYLGETERSEVEFFWQQLYLNNLDREAEAKGIKNWEKIWKPRIQAEINEYINWYVASYDISDDVYPDVDPEPDIDGYEDETPFYQIPFEEYGQAQYLERIGTLRGNIFISLDALEDYIKPFWQYVIAVRRNANGTYQIWVADNS